MGAAIVLCPSASLQALSPSNVTCQRRLPHSCSNGKHLIYPQWKTAFVSSTSFLSPSPLLFRLLFTRTDIAASTWRNFAAASGGDALVEDAVANVVITEISEGAESSDEAVTPESRRQTKGNQQRRNANSRNVTVSVDELVNGVVFSGKVVSIQTFGAFVDIGAYTNGLIHISRLSKSFVKKVEDVVQVGQEVTVKILDVDIKANRIALMLHEEEEERERGGEGDKIQGAEKGSKEGPTQSQQQKRAPRKRNETAQPTTKLQKGETVTGVVKNIIKSGVFLSLPDGMDGYLPASEVALKGPTSSLETLFRLGQEVPVRVLRVEKGRVTLTTKKELDLVQINEALNKGSDEVATSPFAIAFRQNEIIATFLAEREKQRAQQENAGNVVGVDTLLVKTGIAVREEAIATHMDSERVTEETDSAAEDQDVGESEEIKEDKSNEIDAALEPMKSEKATDEEVEEEPKDATKEEIEEFLSAARKAKLEQPMMEKRNEAALESEKPKAQNVAKLKDATIEKAKEITPAAVDTVLEPLQVKDDAIDLVATAATTHELEQITEGGGITDDVVNKIKLVTEAEEAVGKPKILEKHDGEKRSLKEVGLLCIPSEDVLEPSPKAVDAYADMEVASAKEQVIEKTKDGTMETMKEIARVPSEALPLAVQYGTTDKAAPPAIVAGEVGLGEQSTEDFDTVDDLANKIKSLGDSGEGTNQSLINESKTLVEDDSEKNSGKEIEEASPVQSENVLEATVASEGERVAEKEGTLSVATEALESVRNEVASVEPSDESPLLRGTANSQNSKHSKEASGVLEDAKPMVDPIIATSS